MRIAIIGRTNILLDTARLALNAGHQIVSVVTSKAAPEYSKGASDFQQLAKELDIPFAQGSKILDFSEMLQHSNADIALSINYTGVIPEEIVNIFPHGILNAHGGDLPRYRGNACQAWAIINGERHIGLCIHKMIGGELDSGDILEKKIYPIDINTRIGEVYQWFERDIPELMIKAVNNIVNNKNFSPTIQSKNPKDILRCYPRLPEDGQIDWSLSAIQILRLVNASSEPYSGAFAYVGNTKVIIWRAHLFEYNENYLAVPGQVGLIDKVNGHVLVLTGNGALVITDIEVEGWRGKPSEFFKSIRTRLK
jgi:UDP-4-amino-4-deoxy-L-arabinose formyltransferase/UDP-glucuronic acid dehydrogenase (UDP-4-keto-hexauronic acid decarboxylating)